MTLSKAKVTLGGELLAATGAIAWKFQTGTQPFQTVYQVHRSTWARLGNRMGEPLELVVEHADGKTTTVRDVYILHVVASNSPNRVAFQVSDKRWLWAYKMVVRDYNIPKTSGDRTVLYDEVPVVENRVTVDEYDFKPYSLRPGGKQKWIAQEVVRDVFNKLTEDDTAGLVIESWPLKDDGGEQGTHTVQNVMLRDRGDVAAARAMALIPGARVYIDANGFTTIIDATDRQALREYWESRIVQTTWAGEFATYVDRKHVRPSKARVHYTREVECLFTFSDDYRTSASGAPDPSTPYLENVIPTVDPVTTLLEYDPVVGDVVRKEVPAGTWVNVHTILRAWDADRPVGSLRWNFDVIAAHWFKGDLEGLLGGASGRGVRDDDPDANLMARVQAIRQHFRQSFRANRRYSERFRQLAAVRVAPEDPVTGARGLAAVWGQVCIIPTLKGQRMARRRDPEAAAYARNVDFLPEEGIPTVRVRPGPGRVQILDRDQAIFRIDWQASPYATVDTILPCHLVDENGSKAAPTRNPADQDSRAFVAGMRVDGSTHGIFLAPTMELRVIMTFVPAAPNTENQFHIEEVSPEDVQELFNEEQPITGGVAPPIDLFVPPGESTARFSWTDDDRALASLKQLLGTDDPDPANALGLLPGLDGIPGYTWTNKLREIQPHAKSLAAEVFASYADNLHGRVESRSDGEAPRLTGNTSSASINVTGAQSAKVSVSHEFPFQNPALSRFALMPDVTRQLVLGIVPFGERDR